MENRVFFGILAIASFMGMLLTADGDPAVALFLLVPFFVCAQKSGVVNWIDEIKRED